MNISMKKVRWGIIGSYERKAHVSLRNSAMR